MRRCWERLPVSAEPINPPWPAGWWFPARVLGRQKARRLVAARLMLAQGLSKDEIGLKMGFFNAQGQPNMGPLENLVSELYAFFSIEGAPSDPGRRVMLAHAYEAYAGLRPL